MAYLEFSKDGKTYAEADGRMSGVRYRDCCGEKQRAFISFFVCYGYRRTEFDDNKGLYINCVAFGKRAEFINWLNEQNKAIVLVRGELTEQEYKGKMEERLVVSWVQSEQEIETNTKQGKQKDPFDDCDI